MKKILFLLFILPLLSQAQFPNTITSGNSSTLQKANGAFGAMLGYVFAGSYGDTTAANLSFIKNVPGIVIRNIDTLWQRNNTATKWIKITGGTSVSSTLTDGLIDGGIVTWTGTGLVFDITPAVYVLGGDNYSSSASTITLDPADGTFGRYDAIIVNSSGVVSKITGTPAASPVFPQNDPATEIILTYVFVDAGATTPTQISDVIVYDENTEWTTATTGGATANFASTTFANHGTKSIAATWAGSSGLLFTNGSSLVGSNYTTVSFYIRLTATMANNVNVSLQFYNNTTAVSNGLNCSFSKLTTGSWQLVSFNISQFTFTGAFNRVRISLTGTNASTVYFDWIRLQGNATPPPPQLSAYARVTDGSNTATATGSDQLKFRVDNTLSVLVGNNDATHGDNVLFKVDSSIIATKYYVNSLSGITADNGLTASTSTNVQLGSSTNAGSPLTHTTYINTTANYALKVNSSVPSSTEDAAFIVENTAAGFGIGIKATSVNSSAIYGIGGVGVRGESVSGLGVWAISTNSTGLQVTSNNSLPAFFETNPAAGNTVRTILQLQRTSTSAGSAGNGSSIDFHNAGATANTSIFSNQLISKLTSVTASAETSQFIITGVNSGSTVDLLTIYGEGAIKLNPITATAASAITAADGMLIYVNSTNGTFTSVGIWARENGTWVKL